MTTPRSPTVEVEGEVRVTIDGYRYAVFSPAELLFTAAVEGQQVVLRRDGEPWAAWDIREVFADLDAERRCICRVVEEPARGRRKSVVRVDFDPRCRLHEAPGVLRRG